MKAPGIGRTAAALLLLAVVAGALLLTLEFYPSQGKPGCLSIQSGVRAVSQTDRSTFGAVTEYKITGQDRWTNAITTDGDGSVWVAEQEPPGVAHLFPENGTLVEYGWPGYKSPKLPDCVPYVNASGIAIWNGRVWATDEFGNSIVGVNPADGSVQSVNTTGKASFPYWLAAGPDGALWFTADSTPARLGRIFANLSVKAVTLNGMGSDQPLQLDFVNSSLAYFSALNESTNSTTHACQCDGRVYSFDPSIASSSITPTLVGGGYKLVLPTSVSYSEGRVWVAQHGASSVASYEVSTGTWTRFPTSVVPWTDTTLPLVVDAGVGGVWFNEHLANKIAFIDPVSGTLTEYSESQVPATGASGIQNDLSISAAGGGLWFTSMSGNYIGFVDGAYEPPVHVSATGGNVVRLAPGGNATVRLEVTGSWTAAMNVSVSDSEGPSSTPSLLKVVASTPSIPHGVTSPYALGVALKAEENLAPGDYTVAVTVSDGTVQQTAYLFVEVA